MNIQSVGQVVFEFLGPARVEVEAVAEQFSSDAGLVPIREFDRRLGWTEGFAAQIRDGRCGGRHTILEMVRQRVFGILAGYEDQNDHDTLRSDGVFKLIAGRSPDGLDLASQPTLSRLENAVTVGDLFGMRDWFLDRFVEGFESEPARVTLDVDTMDDPVHGQQQLALFHDYYKQDQYQVRVTTCAENDQVVLPTLLLGNASAKLGAADEWVPIITRLRSRFPGVAVHLRGDSGFGGGEEYRVLESLPNVTYTMGFAMNDKLKELAQAHREEAEAAQAATGQPQLRYLLLKEYQSKYWDAPKTVVVKTEVTAHSSSQRAIVTNHPDAAGDPEGAYRAYALRGESENRNKELKCDLCLDRLSDHRFMANFFRVHLHCLAHNLVARLRHVVARHAPPAAEADPDPPATPCDSEVMRRKRHNDRRRTDRLAQAQPNTWRMLVIKVAARVVVSCRRVRIELSSTWPNLNYLRRAALAVAAGLSK